MSVDQEYRETADDIVSRPEFQEEPRSLVERALDWFFRELGEIFGGVLGSGGGYIVGYAILAVALGLAAYFVWRFFPRRRLAAGSEHAWIDQRTTVRRSRREWLAEADEAERAGEWDRAVHARYHAMTTGLADDGELPNEAATTSGEHRRAFASGAAPGRVDVFDRATDRYERVWFGGGEADRPDSRELADADATLLTGDDR